MRGRGGRRIGLVGLAALLTLTGCASAAPGHGTQAAPRGGGDARTPNQLATLLMPVPGGSTVSTSAFDAVRTPSLDAFSKSFYGGATDGGHLRRAGVTAVAHEGWTAADGNAAEVVLFLFSDAASASDWVEAETAALADSGAMDAPLDAVPGVTGRQFTQYAGGGSQDRRYYGVHDRVAMLFEFLTPPHSGPGQAPDWVGTQYARLG